MNLFYDQEEIDAEFDDLARFTKMLKEIIDAAAKHLPKRAFIYFMAEVEAVGKSFLDSYREDNLTAMIHVDMARESIQEAQNEISKNADGSDESDNSPPELDGGDREA